MPLGSQTAALLSSPLTVVVRDQECPWADRDIMGEHEKEPDDEDHELRFWGGERAGAALVNLTRLLWLSGLTLVPKQTLMLLFLSAGFKLPVS